MNMRVSIYSKHGQQALGEINRNPIVYELYLKSGKLNLENLYPDRFISLNLSPDGKRKLEFDRQSTDTVSSILVASLNGRCCITESME